MSKVSANVGNTVWLWARAIVDALGATPTNANMRLLAAWIGGEHGWQWNGTQNASNNPLDTALKVSGSHNLSGNSASVQVYPDMATGLKATIDTLHQTNPSYATIVRAIKNSDLTLLSSPNGQKELDTWGGSAGYAQYLLDSLLPSVPNPPSSYLASGTVAKASGVLAKLETDLKSGAGELNTLLGLNQFIKPGANTSTLITGAVVAAIVLVLISGAVDV